MSVEVCACREFEPPAGGSNDLANPKCVCQHRYAAHGPSGACLFTTGPVVPVGDLLCGYGYPDGALCKVPAGLRHQHVLAYDYDAVEDDQAKRDLVRDWDVDDSTSKAREQLAAEQATKAKAVTDERFHGGSRLD